MHGKHGSWSRTFHRLAWCLKRPKPKREAFSSSPVIRAICCLLISLRMLVRGRHVRTVCVSGSRAQCCWTQQGEGLSAFRDCWGANAFLQAAPEVSKPAGCFIPLEQHDQSLFKICCVCHFILVIYSLPVLQNTSFSLRLLSLEMHVSTLSAVPDTAHYLSYFLSLCSVTAPLVCA